MLKSQYKLFFSTLGNMTRLEIIQALRKGPMNVTELTKKCEKWQDDYHPKSTKIYSHPTWDLKDHPKGYDSMCWCRKCRADLGIVE